MNKTILRLAIPNILTNLSVPLLGIVDTALMGHLDSPIYLGAVAIGGTVFSFLYWGMGFLRMGTTGLAAQAFGEKNAAQQALILTHALSVALIAGILLVAFQVPIAHLSFWLIPGEADIMEQAQIYFFIRIFAAPATISLYALNGWFLGMQNARIPMILAITGNIVNIGLSVLLVVHYEMGVAGVAWATVGAQYLTFGLSLILFSIFYFSKLQLPNKDAILDPQGLQKFFLVNADIFLRTVCLIFVFAFFTAQSSLLGPIVLAANQIVRQFQDIMAYGVDGFAFATESLVGRYMGAKDEENLRKALRLLFIWGIGLGLLFGIIYAVFGRVLLYIFTDQLPVIDVAQDYLIWIVFISIFASVAFMYDGAYIGATASKAMRNTMLFSTIVVFLPAYYLSLPWLEDHALWFSMLMFMLARTGSMAYLAPRNLFMKFNIEEKGTI
ncbi:MAG: MATE family efflux transporter [Bacteroidota bacterium]